MTTEADTGGVRHIAV